MSTPFDAQCSKCGKRFECAPGKLNSTEYLGEVSFGSGVGGFLPKCPHCSNWRDNQLVNKDGTLSDPLRF